MQIVRNIDCYECSGKLILYITKYVKMILKYKKRYRNTCIKNLVIRRTER